MKKDDREIMNILEAFDLTGCAHSAAQLVGCDPKTVRRWVDRRDRGLPVAGPARRGRLIDPFAAKVEEWVDRSHGHVRADVMHQRLVAMGFDGDERTTRRAVAEAKARWRAGHRRTYRPWITGPGIWCQFDWGVGPAVPFAGGPPRATLLFCLWLAWSRFRVVIPTWDRTLPTLLACLDSALRRAGGAPTYALTDNEKTVTVEHIAHVAVRHPQVVAAGRHDGMQVATCVPFDPESKGGSEATVRIAKADLVPTKANLLDAYPDMGALVAAHTSGEGQEAPRGRQRRSARQRQSAGEGDVDLGCGTRRRSGADRVAAHQRAEQRSHVPRGGAAIKHQQTRGWPGCLPGATGLCKRDGYPRTRMNSSDGRPGGMMDFPAQLEALQTNVAKARADVQAAAAESRDRLRQRIDQAQVDVDRAVQEAAQEASTAAESARSKWAQMKADAAARMDDVKAKIDKRGAQLDAGIAADDALWAEDSAAAAIDYAGWALDNARLAILDAIDARAYADDLAKAAGR